MTRKVPFGQPMRDTHFQFSPLYTPLNHGSYGAYPRLIQDKQNEFTQLAAERPDTFIVYDLPKLIDESREAVAPILGASVDEVVFVPNASTAVNVVLRNLKFEEGDVVLHFSTIYGACEKTLASISELTPLRCESIVLEYPIEDDEILRLFEEAVAKLRKKGKNIRLAMFDTVLTFPGVRMPWEALVAACKELGVLSLIDGAHGIGHIDLTHLGKVSPDFFVSNCHKWLYTPRGCAVFFVPFRNQHLIRTSIPTSHGYQYKSNPERIDKTPFVHLFEFVATIDYTPYLCVPAAIQFRQIVCGGEEAIRNYSYELARKGGDHIAEVLGTEVMKSKSGNFDKTCFSNVKLPLSFAKMRTDQTHEYSTERDQEINPEDIEVVLQWIRLTAVKEFDTYLQIGFHAEFLWVRLSAQIYLGMESFEWLAPRLKDICLRAQKGQYKQKGTAT